MLVWIVVILLLAAATFFVWASANISSGIYLKAVCRLNTDKKQIALTFDDGPSRYTNEILAILKQHNIEAAFFCIGSRVEAMPDLAKKIANEGHLVANHSYSHTGRFPILGKVAMIKDIERCSQAIEQATGTKPAYFRPPFGVSNPVVAKSVKAVNLKPVGWNIRSLDTAINDSNHILSRIERRLKPGAILLLHDSLPDSPQLLKLIILLAQRNSYTFVRFDKAL